jgi:hypothetical protein
LIIRVSVPVSAGVWRANASRIKNPFTNRRFAVANQLFPGKIKNLVLKLNKGRAKKAAVESR